MAKNVSKYVDGFVLVVPKDKLPTYRRMARAAGKAWKKCGALEYRECIGDDLVPNMGDVKCRLFPEMAKAKAGEVVLFSYITYKSKAHRDQVNAKVMKEAIMTDPKYKDMPMPFDMKRMAYGGFKIMVDA